MTFPEEVAQIQIPTDRNFHPTAVVSGIHTPTKQVVPIEVVQTGTDSYALRMVSSASSSSNASMITPVTITTAATLILDIDLDRKGHMLYNAGSETLYLGTDNSVNVSNGIPVSPGSSFNVDLAYMIYTGQIFGIVAGTQTEVRGIIYYA